METRNLRTHRVLFFSISTVDFLQFNNYLNINSQFNIKVAYDTDITYTV